MFRQALRTALVAKVSEYAPAAIVDAYGHNSLTVFFEALVLAKPTRDRGQSLDSATAVAVLYAVDDIERLIVHVNAAPLVIEHSAHGLTASGMATFAGLKEGMVEGTAYAELRFSITGAIAPE
jgi:hypothetical protein